MDDNKIKGFRWKLGLTNCFTKDCTGRCGGLAVFWKNEVNLHIRGVSRLYIDADETEKDGFIWRFMGFYGKPSLENKDVSWRALRVLNAARKRPWLFMGDFNEILLSCEKEGGVPRPQACMDKFREVLEDCGLHDLGFEGMYSLGGKIATCLSAIYVNV